MATTSIRLTQAVEQYERHLRAQGLAENTVKNTTQSLNRGVALWGDILVSSITHAHIDNLFSHYGWKASTRNLYLSRINVFFRWARERRYMAKDSSPTEGWKAVRVPKVRRTRIPVEDFALVLDSAPHPRDRAVCALGLYTFLRGSEIATLRISDLDLDHNMLSVYRHKTREADNLPVSAELREEMIRWLNWYESDQGRPRPNWFLTPAKNPNHTGYDRETGRIYVDSTTPASLRPSTKIGHPYDVVKRSLEAMGYDVYWEGAHTLRRSGARALADSLREQGFDAALMRVASMLGHSDVRITQRYIGWELERDQRDAAIAGKVMFPALAQRATVTPLRREA